jgi:thiol-disulfide isomerase/thioredoxin
MHHVNENLLSGWNHIEYNCLFLAYLLPFLGWIIVKPYLYNAKEDRDTKYNFRRFKNSPDVFNSISLRQAEVKNDPEGLGITLGNPEAENTLIKVCNPYCGPCAKSFPILEDLLLSNYEKWKVQIIFTARADKNDSKAIPVAHFLQSYEQKDNSNTIKILGDWYNAKTKDYDDYLAKHPVSVDFESQKVKLAAMSNWCHDEDIRFTPTYYVNGRRLPDSYGIDDLKNIY